MVEKDQEDVVQERCAEREQSPRPVLRVYVRRRDRPLEQTSKFFDKRIRSDGQHHATARPGYCELRVPRGFARRNGIDRDNRLLFVTRSLIENGTRLSCERYMAMRFRTVDLYNTRNFVVEHGWKDFSEYHDIKRGWRLRFYYTAPNQLYVKRLKKLRNGKWERPVPL